MAVGGQAYGGRGWCRGRVVTRTGHLAVARVVGVAVGIVVVVVRMAPIVVVVVMIVLSVLVGMVVLVVVPV